MGQDIIEHNSFTRTLNSFVVFIFVEIALYCCNESKAFRIKGGLLTLEASDAAIRKLQFFICNQQVSLNRLFPTLFLDVISFEMSYLSCKFEPLASEFML